jgi:phasin family protein
MASSRHENRETISRISERTADQTSRFGRVAAETGEEAVRASANLLQQNAETLQNAWRFSLDLPSLVIGRSADQIGRTLGLSGNEARAAEHSARNAEMILHSTTAMSKVMTEMSREYFETLRQQIQNNMGRMNDLWRCRTPQDFVAVQSDLVRDNMSTLLESSRRLADMQGKMVDDAKTQINQTIEQMRGAAA